MLACLLSRLVHKWRTQGTHLLPQVGPCLLVKLLVDDHPPSDDDHPPSDDDHDLVDDLVDDHPPSDDDHDRCITMGLCLWTISTLWLTCTSSRAG